MLKGVSLTGRSSSSRSSPGSSRPSVPFSTPPTPPFPMGTTRQCSPLSRCITALRLPLPCVCTAHTPPRGGKYFNSTTMSILLKIPINIPPPSPSPVGLGTANQCIPSCSVHCQPPTLPLPCVSHSPFAAKTLPLPRVLHCPSRQRHCLCLPLVYFPSYIHPPR